MTIASFVLPWVLAYVTQLLAHSFAGWDPDDLDHTFSLILGTSIKSIHVRVFHGALLTGCLELIELAISAKKPVASPTPLLEELVVELSEKKLRRAERYTGGPWLMDLEMEYVRETVLIDTLEGMLIQAKEELKLALNMADTSDADSLPTYIGDVTALPQATLQDT